MDETAVTTKPDWLNDRAKVAGERTEDVVVVDDDGVEDECDDQTWNMLSRSFRQAQTVLDENRALIEEVNGNQESRIRDNMVKNVGLITQIHGNLSKVRSIYSDLSVNFTNMVRKRRVTAVNHRSRDLSLRSRDGDREEDEDTAENSEDDSAEHVPEKSE